MKRFLAIMLVLIVATTAVAQNKGRILGTVTTPDGAVIPGVTVTIASPALIAREMTASTNERGQFRFVLLPVGNFTIKMVKEGYKTVEQTGLTLDFDSTLTINKVMAPADFSEIITITGESPVVDKTSSSIGDKLDLTTLQNQPNTRSVWTMPNLTAGFNDDSALGSVSEGGNALNIDGAIVHDPSTKTVFASITMEAVEQVDVSMFGAPAEYNSFTGASINVVTKSGGNEFSGEANFFYQSKDWVSDNTGDYHSYGLTAPEATDVTNPNVALGGPILQDRIWFFANYSYTKRETDYQLIDQVISQSEDPTRFFAKLSGRWDDRNITYFSYTYYDQYRSHRVAYGSWSTNYEDSLYEQYSDGDTYLLQHSFVLSDDIIFEGRYSGFRGGFSLLPRVEGDTLRDYDSGYMDADSKLSLKNIYDRPRDNYLGTMNYYNDDLGGTHSFKFGGEYEKTEATRFYSNHNYYRTRNGELYRWYDYGEYESTREVHRFGGFAQDSWSVNSNLTLNIGFRYDHWWSKAGDPDAGGLAGDDSFREMDDPAYRIGFAWDIAGDGKTVLRGFVGRYYEGLVSGNIDAYVATVPPTIQYRYRNGEPYVYSISGGSDPGAFVIDEDVSNQYSEGLMLALERELAENMSASVTFVYKKDHDLIGVIYPNATWEQGTASFSNAYGSYSGVYYYDYTLVNPETYTNPEKGNHGVLESPFRDYWGLILEFSKRMSDNWSMRASYTFGRSESNVGMDYGEIQGYENYSNPNSYINAGGVSSLDRPHIFKMSGTYIAPFEIYISPAIRFQSGTPIYLYYMPDGQDSSILIKKAEGDERRDNQFDIDLRLEKSFTFASKYRLGVLFDVFNLLNSDAITGYESTRINSPVYMTPSSIVDARFYQIGVRLIF